MEGIFKKDDCIIENPDYDYTLAASILVTVSGIGTADSQFEGQIDAFSIEVSIPQGNLNAIENVIKTEIEKEINKLKQ